MKNFLNSSLFLLFRLVIFAKTEKQPFQFRLKPVNLRKLVAEIMEILNVRDRDHQKGWAETVSLLQGSSFLVKWGCLRQHHETIGGVNAVFDSYRLKSANSSPTPSL